MGGDEKKPIAIAPPTCVTLVGLNHRSMRVEMRERLAFRPDRLTQAVRELRSAEGVREALILSTCNRVEVLLVTDNEADDG